jgi:two-component system, cell cycle response regulator
MGESAIRIGTLGLTEGDLRVLSSLVRLTAHRPRRYEIGEAGVMVAPDIVIFDGDHPPIVSQWRSKYAAISSIRVSASATAAEPSETPLTRPLVASKLLNALDTMSINTVPTKSPNGTRDSTPAKIADQAPATLANERGAAAEDALVSTATRTRADEVFENLRRMFSARSDEPSKTRALVIDDSPTVRKQLELALRAINVDVDSVESGEDGLKLLATKRYALIFLDVVLPGWDGYQICKTIKKDAAIRETPVVMLTSKSSPFDRIRGSLAGCDTYLTKPVEGTVFNNVLKKYLPAITGSAAISNSKVVSA